MGKKKTNSLELSFSEEFDLKTSELYRAEQVGRQKTGIWAWSPLGGQTSLSLGAACLPRPGAQAGS